MTQLTSTFMDQCIQGRARISQVDQYVDAWHRSSEGESSLADYLGMTEAEYAQWVENPSSLGQIISFRKKAMPAEQGIGR